MADPEVVAAAVSALRLRGIAGPFDAAIVLGTGLGAVIDALEAAVAVPYRDIPGWPEAAVSGHAGRLVAGRLAGRSVLVLAGRSHAYERGDPGAMRLPIAVLAALGTHALVLTNAVGSLRPDLPPGRLVAVADHLNLTGMNPLVGTPGDERFVPMADAYDPALRVDLAVAAGAAGIALGEGVLMWFPGPSFETPAEIRAARALGADLVGMSVVPETVIARFHGLRVAAVSVVTNMAAGLDDGDLAHADTKAVAAAAAPDLARLLAAFLSHRPPV